MKMEMCRSSQSYCLLTKFQISYQFVKDIRAAVRNTSIRVDTSIT